MFNEHPESMISIIFLTNDNRRISRGEVKRKILSHSSIESDWNNSVGLFEVDMTLRDNVVGCESRWMWSEPESLDAICSVRSDLTRRSPIRLTGLPNRCRKVSLAEQHASRHADGEISCGYANAQQGDHDAHLVQWELQKP